MDYAKEFAASSPGRWSKRRIKNNLFWSYWKSTLTPIEKNLKRVLETHAYIQQLCDDSDLPVDKLENTIDSELQELKKAQDALNKALETRRQDMDQVKRRMAEIHTVKSPVKLSDTEIEDLAHSVKMESQIEDYDALSDHDWCEADFHP